MKRRIGIIIFCVLALAVAAFAVRGQIRHVVSQVIAPSLPPATEFHPRPATVPTTSTGDTNSTIEGGLSSSTHYTLETNPKTKPALADPLAYSGALPTQVNLDVPFTSQAPFGNWNMPYQEACEEASAIMVDRFYHAQGGVIDPSSADRLITDMIDYETRMLGFGPDITAAQTAKLIKSDLGYSTVVVKQITSTDDIKKALALGYPVIIPFSGKELHNPNFRNGGPNYHMLVIRGYTPTLFITNDPGTHNGQAYTYTTTTIMAAAHDWNGGDVVNGKPMMVVVIPNE